MIDAAPAPSDLLARAVAARIRPRFGLSVDGFVDRLRGSAVEIDPERLHLDDLYLATACADGDAAAWKEFADVHFDYVRSFARRFDLPESIAEDVVDAVIADLWERASIGRYRGWSSLRTWLGAVVTHAALNAAGRERRRRGSVPALQAAVEAGRPDPPAEEIAAARAVADAVGEALAALPPPERLLVLFHYEQGLTLDQIGGMEGRSKATMSRTLKKVRAELRDRIETVLATRHGTSWREVRPAVDLSRLDLDLASLLGR